MTNSDVTTSMNRLNQKRSKEKETLQTMVRIYCHGNHHTKKDLCPECSELIEYAFQRIDQCPHMETKTFCSQCKTHCYRKDMREKIRQVMRYAGPRMLFHDPITALKHAWVTLRAKERASERQS
ncbi:MAG TPA: nitrous oxide-stimulated promoter family protein [Flexilinea sp.]|nr:nitrous oxide-stimulated promoter family protein [Flexilinea sp.]